MSVTTQTDTLTVTFCDQDELRTTFALSMSAMYKAEVPLYGDLVQIVQDVNQNFVRRTQQESVEKVDWLAEQERLDLERHGAIRLGTPAELSTVRRLFALIGLYPVGYYDLSIAGLPMHATAFRPISQKSLSINPFRVFTTLLRPELLEPDARKLAMSLLERRSLFSTKLKHLIDIGEAQGGLTPIQGTAFIAEAMKTFRWQPVTMTSYEEYTKLKSEHPILADIACFGTAHVNHLTPRVLDIDMAQAEMKAKGLEVKSRIEGPPLRQCPILLRQTSFLALEEKVQFASIAASDAAIATAAGHGVVNGSHRARFGEIEQRGCAVTASGRKLYDEILEEAMKTVALRQTSASKTDEIIRSTFEKYPDNWIDLVGKKLVYCLYSVTEVAAQKLAELTAHAREPFTVSTLLSEGILRATPQTYEDFLPFSAAGIFQSNIGDSKQGARPKFEVKEDKSGFERSLGTIVRDADQLYASAQEESLSRCVRDLKLIIHPE